MSTSRQHPDSGGRRDWSRVNQWLLWIGLAGAVAWLFFGHGEHLLRLAPFLLLLACPLMHLFGHGHGGHGSHSSHRRDEPPDKGEPLAQPEQRSGGHVH